MLPPIMGQPKQHTILDMWQRFTKLQHGVLTLMFNGLTDEGKVILCFLYHPMYLCCHLQEATDLDPKIPLYINAVERLTINCILSSYIHSSKVQDPTLARIKLHLPFLCP